MKRTVRFLLVFAILVIALTGCTRDEDSSIALKLRGISVSGAGAAAAASEEGGSSPAGEEGAAGRSGPGLFRAAADDAGEPQSSEATVFDYLSVESIETELGIVQIPVLDTGKLKSQDAKLANEMFRNLESSILQNVDEVLRNYKEEHMDSLSEERKENLLCETELSLNDNVLSILLHYQELSFYAPSMWHYEGVNLDIRTGSAVPGMELVEKAGYSPDLMAQSVMFYSELYEDYLNETSYYFQLGEQQALPNPDEETPRTFQFDSIAAVRSVTDKPEPSGQSWDALDRFPLVFYEGQGKVSVVARIETAAGAGYEWQKIRLSTSEAGLFAANHIAAHEYDFWHYPKSEEAALYAVFDLFALDDDGKTPDGAEMFFEILRVENLRCGEEAACPFFVIQAFSERGTQKDTEGFYAISVFDDRMMEMDATREEWRVMPKGTPVIDASFLYTEQAESAVAVVSHHLNPYELWSLFPYNDVNVFIYSREEVPEEDRIGLYIWPRDEDGALTLISGELDQQGVFQEMSEVVPIRLERGTGTYLEYMKEQEGRFAVRIENSAGSCLYLLEDPAGHDAYEYLYE